ncbi:MAG: acetyl-CoA carboxylase biotin carboxyl carrier protein [Verrucomicrobiales bacterium]|nr:acetyl-CoA carboxylase biotin carboxyl carrier protein [Verrucomicrobiales bacterium]
MDIKEIKQIIELMNENELTHFHLERDGDKIKLQKGGDLEALQQALAAAQPVAVAAPVAAAAPISAAPSADSDGLPAGEVEITSPMVGTFYRSSDPESAPFADTGSEVGVDSTVCIIEAMKVMNEISSEIKGTITKVLVENGTPVQYGEPLFWVKKS